MIWLLIGAIVLFTLIAGLRAFERASVTSIKALVAWTAALGGLTLALLLILTGRGGAAIGALVMFGPLIWQKLQAARMQSLGQRAQGTRQESSQGTGHQGTGQAGASGHAGWGSPRTGGTMSRQEAYQVLGLKPGASEAEVREAHHRLMRKAHRDVGGSEWIATRINQARDALLG